MRPCTTYVYIQRLISMNEKYIYIKRPIYMNGTYSPAYCIWSVISPISKTQLIISFSTSLLPRSVEKRPRRLRSDNEMKRHSKCNRLYITCIHRDLYIRATCTYIYYGVATDSMIDKIIGLFCRIMSLLQGSFTKETYNFIDPTNQSHPIRDIETYISLL